MPAARFLTSAAEPAGFPPDDAAEVAFVGRSNSGKSSAINAVTGSRKLARVSKTPGRTQMINFFDLGPGRRIVDLPGYGYAKVAPDVQKRWRGLLEAYFGGRRGLRGLVVTVDVRRGLTELDHTMFGWAGTLGLEILLLLTKADKLSRNQALNRRREVAAQAPGGLAPILFSAVTGAGADEARAQLEAWYAGAGADAPEPGKKKPRGGTTGL